MAGKKTLTYKDAGHNLERSDSIIEQMKARIPHIGGFSGAVPLPRRRYQQPVMLSATDGVGTKLLVAIHMDKHDTVGIDLVAMVVNDLIVSGGEPSFFLDYIAMGELNPKTIDALITGILEGCDQARCSLAGGETAEMAGMYAKGHYDMAGFGVALAEKKKLVTGEKIRPTDVVIGLESSGIHSNGYTLARAVFEKNNLSLKRQVKELGMKAGEALLEPTRIYVPVVMDLMKRFTIRGMAHITGGGLEGNLNRVLPPQMDAEIRIDSWPRPPIFHYLQEKGPVDEEEMFRVFNMGIGYALVVPEKEASAVVRRANRMGFPAHAIGVVTPGVGDVHLY